MENSDFYKFGFLYFNKEDKRLFVPKKINWLGWTLNFANPISYLIIVSVFAVIIILSFLK